MDSLMQNFWEKILAILCSAIGYKPNRSLKVKSKSAFSPSSMNAIDHVLDDLLKAESGLRRWMDILMQHFWNKVLAILCSATGYKPNRGLKVKRKLAFSPFASMNARDWLSRLWLGILNWEEGFSDSLHVWKHGRRIDMTHFQWTCVSYSHVQRLF